MGVTLHFQSTGTVPGNARPVSMVGGSITVGRGPENDLVLPDPSRVLSKRHCAIEDHGGNPVVIDLSTNGTYLNYGKAPLGKAPTPLNDGDILTLGPYELMVQIAGEGRPAANAPSGEPASSGPGGRTGLADALDDVLGGGDGGDDFLDDLLGSDAPPSGPGAVKRPELGEDGILPPLDDEDLLGPAEDPGAGEGGSRPDHSASASDHVRISRTAPGQIPEDWGDDLLGPQDRGNSIPGPATIPEDDPDFGAPGNAGGDAADPFGWTPQEPAPDRRPGGGPLPGPTGDWEGPRAQPSVPASQDAARAFLQAAGVAKLPEDELEATMARLGAVFRIMVSGLREILMARATVKSEFRIDQTMIAAGGNNPLKFSVSADQAVEAMVKPETSGYLEATAAAGEAMKDIRAHEIAMVSGMEAALKGILRELSPQALESRIEGSGGLAGMLKGKKARYWEVYEKLYSEISDQAESDFQDLFAKAFSEAYRAQLEKLK